MKKNPLAQYGFNGHILNPFDGREMTCILCGKKESGNFAESNPDPDILSDWRAVELNSDIFYACVDEFPPDGASKEEYEIAYARFLEAAIKARAELVAKRRQAILAAIRDPDGKLKRHRRRVH